MTESGSSANRRRTAPGGYPVPVVLAETARSVLGERVAIPLAVGGPHERGDDVEVPILDVGCLPPEVGETEVDVELEEVDPGRSLWHAEKPRTGVGRSRFS
jgi:hypothetical protein